MVENQEIDEGLRTGVIIHKFVCAVLGLLINAPIIFILAKRLTKNSHVDIKLCAIVAAADVLTCLCLIFRSIFSKFPYDIFEVHHAWCTFDALVTAQLTIFSSYFLAIMSIERFLLICLNISLSIYIWYTILAIGVFPYYISACISAYYGLATLTAAKIYCSFTPQGPAHVTFLLINILFYLSLFLVIFSYIGIMIMKYKQCLNQLNLNIPKEQVYRECRSTIFKSFLYIILYLLVFSGKIYSVTYIIITGKPRTMLMDIIATCLVSFSSFVNAVILLYMNQEVRKSFMELMYKVKRKILNIQSH
ncbi:hypothetical protein CONCODRAFT_11998 [Conidiobolus coronatus NRRL 28638]|uniref:G-protein coupled receptors family 1 profile domain-containing protein n=1 Tax=Conidiobolus coronatus (strain ATCC 28846 / CBS 209.66 / NRRL 28638) TaxID=796925 RepID=A0A137NTZ8_CONC2|nr:hypothetical protein CONCODRAFT_11998 [Conidiobolus coronatus NRRL 28638]|eukprot:KXN66209.1 hypothetical protein CONCODRAFT_11998 [Conidiobolus coronatus NRRL 28638]